MPRRKATKTAAPAAEKPTEQPTQAAQSQPEAPASAEQAEQAKANRPDPFVIAGDYKAGVQLLESRRYWQMQLKFNDKPSQAVIDTVKNEGFTYNGKDKVWTKQTYPDAMATRIDAERLFKQVADMIRQELGHEQGVSGRG